jgi:DNA-binding transcriptional regulator YdaS (Cro superfamily)
VPTVQARTLRRASAIVGGIQALATKLGVEPLRLRDWMEGSATPPGDVFLKAVEIVLERDAAPPNR